MIEVETWAVISTLGGFLASFIGLAFGIGKYTLWQMQKQLDVRFAGLKEDAAEWRQVEKDLMQLKVDLSANFVRREDYIRGQTVLEAKMDALNLRIENLQLRGGK
ncbi:MAG: hypothetical protein NC112_09175 [Oxalobacter formigenes]|nr:hypothetical protein [Oxalobacter formigenes]